MAIRAHSPWVSSMRITRIFHGWAPAPSQLLPRHLHGARARSHTHMNPSSTLQHAKCYLFVVYILLSTIIFVISNNSRLCRFIYISEHKWKRACTEVTLVNFSASGRTEYHTICICSASVFSVECDLVVDITIVNVAWRITLFWHWCLRLAWPSQWDTPRECCADVECVLCPIFA